jgi:hypothetical protein
MGLRTPKQVTPKKEIIKTEAAERELWWKKEIDEASRQQQKPQEIKQRRETVYTRHTPMDDSHIYIISSGLDCRQLTMYPA